MKHTPHLDTLVLAVLCTLLEIKSPAMRKLTASNLLALRRAIHSDPETWLHRIENVAPKGAPKDPTKQKH
jgi:hypothetical protein